MCVTITQQLSLILTSLFVDGPNMPDFQFINYFHLLICAREITFLFETFISMDEVCVGLLIDAFPVLWPQSRSQQ